MMRKVVAALVVLAVSLTALGAASTLGIGGGGAQSGTKSATCDGNGVRVSWILGGADPVKVEGVRIGDVADACSSGGTCSLPSPPITRLFVRVSTITSGVITPLSLVICPGQSSYLFGLSPQPSIADITGVTVTIVTTPP